MPIIKYNKVKTDKKYIVIPETSGYIVGSEKVKINMPDYMKGSINVSFFDNDNSGDINHDYTH